jgi:hypothetical protein
VRSPEEFEAFLREQIAPRLRGIEGERRAYRERREAARLSWLWKAALALAGIAVATWAHSFQLAVLAAAAPFGIDWWLMRRVPDTATPLLRAQVLKPVVEFWDASFHYDPALCIASGEFDASRLFAGVSYNRYGGEDLVRGRHGATDFRFCELRVKDVQKRKNRTETREVFHGLFFVADFNKAFHGQTLVLPDVAERAFGTLGRALQRVSLGAGELVQLENPDFERAFVVRATDPTEARYLLSPSLMERILRFHEHSGARLRLGFLSGRIYAAIPFDGDLFAVDASRPFDLGRVREWVTELRFATSLIDELDLNTRIWSKGPSGSAPAPEPPRERNERPSARPRTALGLVELAAEDGEAS